MRLLVITPLFPSSVAPGAGIFNLRHLAPLARDCSVRVIAPRPWRPGRRLPPPEEGVGGLPVRNLPWFPPPKVGRALYPVLLLPALARAVEAEARRRPPDVLLATWLYPDGIAAAWLARERAWPLVLKAHGSDVHLHLRHRARRAQIVAAGRRAHRVLAVSEALARALAEAGVPEERLLARRNGVDAELFRPTERAAARRELGLPEAGPLLLYVGNLVPEKGPQHLLAALPLLDRLLPVGARVCFAGDGPLCQRLRARAAALGVGERVRFAGRQPPEAVPRWLAAADLLCLPSLREGCPNVVLEALACGRPVVGSSVGGVPELLDEGSGSLAPPGEPAALADALAAALGRRWEPEALRARVLPHTWERCAATLRAELVAAAGNL